MGYSKDPFGMNRRTRKTTKGILSLGIGLVSGISKAHKAAQKEAERRRRADERENLALAKKALREAEKFRKDNDRFMKILEKERKLEEKREKESWYIMNGYIKKQISFFTKYITLSLIDDDLKAEIQSKLKLGEKHVYVHQSILDDLSLKYKEKTKVRKSYKSKKWHNSHPGINKDEDLPDYI